MLFAVYWLIFISEACFKAAVGDDWIEESSDIKEEDERRETGLYKLREIEGQVMSKGLTWREEEFEDPAVDEFIVKVGIVDVWVIEFNLRGETEYAWFDRFSSRVEWGDSRVAERK